MNASDFFALPRSLAAFESHFRPDVAPWEWLKAIGPALAGVAAAPRTGPWPAGLHVEGRVWVHPSVKLPPYGTLIGPLWIGEGTELRPGVYLRGHVVVGAGCVLGNACEFKQCVLLDGVQAPHFNYVGDSVLGNRAHLGAGVICSNLRLDQQPVTVRAGGVTHQTGLRKFGAVLGDGAEVGCNAVLNPGAVLGRRALVMPAMAFSGYLPPATIAHTSRPVKLLARRD